MYTVKDESQREQDNRQKLVELYKQNPIHDPEKMENATIWLNRIAMIGLLYQNELYQKILDVPGIIMEFGCRYGRNECIWTNLRGIYEPYNHSRKIVAFDTFEGFPHVSKEDGDHEIAQAGNLSVPKEQVEFLTNLLTCHEQEAPISHKQKFELVKGDILQTVQKYIEDNPQTIISFAYFDTDLYEPTIHALKVIWHRMPKGGVIAFDELNFKPFQGETVAVLEFFKEKGVELKMSKSKFTTVQAYFIK